MFKGLKSTKYTLIGVFLAGLLVMSGCQTALGLGILAWQLGVFDKDNKDGNNAPQILTLTAVPNTLHPGEQAVLTVVAVDSDSDTLTFQWAAPAGTLSSPTLQVTNWTAPTDTTGTYYISVTVTDGKDPVTGKVPVAVTL
jgi:hypothetical protein